MSDHFGIGLQRVCREAPVAVAQKARAIRAIRATPELMTWAMPSPSISPPVGCRCHLRRSIVNQTRANANAQSKPAFAKIVLRKKKPASPMGSGL
jgi:hypothetical protein